MPESTLQTKQLNTTVSRVHHAIGPVAAGMVIDALDVMTFGPVGLVAGLPAGVLAGYWLGRSLGLEKQARLLCAAAAGLYCTVPFTELLPLGTIVGALCRYQESATGHETTPAADNRAGSD